MVPDSAYLSAWGVYPVERHIGIVLARVGGAHTADVVEAATGINLWAEWADIEIDKGDNQDYYGYGALPRGIVIDNRYRNPGADNLRNALIGR